MNPFCPHITEELYERLGNKSLISLSEWPKAGKIDEKLEKAEEDFEVVIRDINHIINLIREKEKKDVKNIYIYVIPNELSNYDADRLSKRLNKKVYVFSTSDKKKYDPESRSKKAKPGKPGIYAE